LKVTRCLHHLTELHLFRTSSAAYLSLGFVVFSLLLANFAQAEQQPRVTIEASKNLPKLDTSSCLTQLDATVALAREKTDVDGYLESRFAQLERQCPDLPHFAHNQGVLAAQAERWNDAISHLDRSLQLDPRASMTYKHLQEIFEHRAAQAYARALKTRITLKQAYPSVETLNFDRSAR